MTQPPGDLLSWLGIGGGTVAIGYALFRMLFRRVVRDGLEVAKDRGETDLVQKLLDLNSSLTKTNDSLRSDFERLATERGKILAKVGKLESDVTYLKKELREAHEEIALLRRQLGVHISPMASDLSDFTDRDDLGDSQ